MKKIFLILTSVSLIAGIGCKKGYLDVNTNPNQSTAADPSLVLPAALATTVANWYPGPTYIAEWMGSWAVSGSYALSGSDPGPTYKQTTGIGDGLWQSVYDNMEDYQYIEDKANANGQPFLEGAARIMKAFNYQHLVDLFNDVPYSQALKGVAFLRPTYDKGMDVYDSCFVELQKGIDLINSAGITVSSSSDIMFAGDKDSWMQFANTIRLEMLLKMSQLSTKPVFFQPNLALTMAEPAGFLSADALVQPGYLVSAGQGNPFWQRFYNLSGGQVSSFGDYWAANDYAVSFYHDNKDPRLAREYLPIKASTAYPDTVIGNKLGLISGNPVNGKFSVFGPGVLRGYLVTKSVVDPLKDSIYKVDPATGATASAVMMLAAESYFLQAEAVVLGYLPGDAKDLYESGVTSSFVYLGAREVLKKVPDSNGVVKDSVILDPTTSATRYYSQAGNTKTNFATANTTLDKQSIILRQKWAALNSVNSTESYNDYRKFDYLHTGAIPYPGPLGGTILSYSPYIDIAKIPTRLKYPTSEYSRNPDNVNAEGNIDHQVDKIWWMQ
jgi:Starch-binding associating with outer membrane